MPRRIRLSNSPISKHLSRRNLMVFFFLSPVPSSEGMDEIVSRAAAKGIFMFNHSASPVTACTQNVVLDQYSAGYKVGEYAARWNNEGVGPSEPKVPQGDPERSAGLLQTRTGLLAL